MVVCLMINWTHIFLYYIIRQETVCLTMSEMSFSISFFIITQKAIHIKVQIQMWHQVILWISLATFIYEHPDLCSVVLLSYCRISLSDQWDFQPWAAGMRRGQNRNQSHGEMKDSGVRLVALTQPSCTWSIRKGVGTRKEKRHFAWCFDWVQNEVQRMYKESGITGVAVVRYSKIVYAIYCMCVCIQPSLVFSGSGSKL